MRKLTQIFKALSDPTRIRIISLLQSGGELCVCDLMEALGLPQSTVSRHLAYLRNADLVDDERRGVWMYYRLPEETGQLTTKVLGAIDFAIEELQQTTTDRQRLTDYLKTKQPDACEKRSMT